MRVIQALKCILGRHQLAWVYSSDSSCEQRGNCVCCEFQDSREFHEWREEKTEEQSSICRICSRCGKYEQCVFGNHTLEWIYTSGKSCDQHGKCQNCEYQETRELHDWGEWKLGEKGSASRSCSRCGKQDHMDPLSSAGSSSSGVSNAGYHSGETGGDESYDMRGSYGR